MNICLAGYYFYKPLLETIADCKYEAFIVAHKEIPKGIGIEGKEIPNVGLEFGCYDWYLKNKWDGDDVLFMHDDSEITREALDEISRLERDQVFLFSSEEEAKANGYCHGRAMFCSSKFLRKLYIEGGFWFDEGNKGDIAETRANSPNYQNLGIRTFRQLLWNMPKDMTVNRIAVVPGLKNGYRGRL